MKFDIKLTPKSPEGDFLAPRLGVAGGVFEESNKPLFISFKGYFLTKIKFSRTPVVTFIKFSISAMNILTMCKNPVNQTIKT